ncbi:MAG: NUDIX domain-containing protein [Alphaproteobacteria bacterium]|nr:NUDIX domain-containing protein [Alphaproteobacteria bacterium]
MTARAAKARKKVKPAAQSAARYPDRPWAGVIIIVLKEDNVLLVRRAKEPHAGLWGLPGGAIELGEGIYDAAKRETREETGVTIDPFAIIDIKEIIQRDARKRVEYHYCPIIIAAHWVKGRVRAGSDAAEAQWVAAADIGATAGFPDTAFLVQRAMLLRAL